MKFEGLNIIPPLLKALDREWFSTPTEVQEKVIPVANKWKDVLGCAQTGSGKTLSFTLPILQTLYNNRLEKWLVDWKVKRKILALILVPTRELAIQIWETFKPYCTNVNFKHTVIFGWVNQFHQVKAIEKWVDILIATPGRLEDLISQSVIKLSYVEIFVLDEADRMLDMWSLWDINKIIKRIPKQKQTLFFSATMPKKIRELSWSLMESPENITVEKDTSKIDLIKQEVYRIDKDYKRQLMQKIIKRRDLESIIIFVNRIDDSEKVFEYVKSTWLKCDYINKNKTQNARQNSLKALKDWSIKILVATDIASRWLDVSNLSCVVNYDLPLDAETYIHRIWRTWRAGNYWLAISFCSLSEKDRLKNIEKLLWKDIWIIKDDSYKTERVQKWKSDKTISINKKKNPAWRKKKYYWRK